ncbi:hypothetical protein Tco_0005212, partial [Tanacetum coccineum]
FKILEDVIISLAICFFIHSDVIIEAGVELLWWLTDQVESGCWLVRSRFWSWEPPSNTYYNDEDGIDPTISKNAATSPIEPTPMMELDPSSTYLSLPFETKHNPPLPLLQSPMKVVYLLGRSGKLKEAHVLITTWIFFKYRRVEKGETSKQKVSSNENKKSVRNGSSKPLVEPIKVTTSNSFSALEEDDSRTWDEDNGGMNDNAFHVVNDSDNEDVDEYITIEEGTKSVSQESSNDQGASTPLKVFPH